MLELKFLTKQMQLFENRISRRITYHYHCPRCDNEETLSYRDPRLSCPKCGTEYKILGSSCSNN
ncbi:MAG: hypothetical protein PHF67_05365 [Candidatus Nanoarchaeia archaeon]|nr:hypothetical protein [Candidatus Nanoarchaeia archaeon]